MDARTRLRFYLEQRREMGEQDMVLDSLPISEVLAILGASKVKVSAVPKAIDVAQPDVQVALPKRRVVQVSEEKAPVLESPAWPDWLEQLEVPKGIVVPLSPELSNDVQNLEQISAHIASCSLCELSKTALNPVAGAGKADAGFMCVGEAPGQQEDETGLPFVGAAGQLLDKILAAIGFAREQVFICNVLKHRPPGNRNPTPNEIGLCKPFLQQQISIVKPKVILALGSFAARTLLQSDLPLGALRGKVHNCEGRPLVVTYHPAALLRNEAWKRPAWEDVKLARRIYDASPGISEA